MQVEHVNKSGRLANNSILVLISRSVEIASALITAGMLARYLGVKEFGEYAFIMALVWIALPVLSAGVPRVLVRDIAQQKEKAERHINVGLMFNSFMILALIPAMLLFGSTLDMRGKLSYVFALLIVACMTLTQTVNSVFIAFGRFIFETVTSLATMVSLLSFILCVVYFDLGFINIFAVTATAYLIGLVTSLALSYRLTGFKPKPTLHLDSLKYLFKESIPLALSQLLIQLFIYTGVFVLKAFADSTDIALFQAPLKIFTGFMIIPMSLMAPLLPVLSERANADELRKEFIKTAQSMFRFLLIFSTSLTMAGVALAGWVIPLIYGEAFTRSIVGLKILLLGMSFFFLNTFFVTISIATRRQKSIVPVQVVGLAASFLLNIALVPAIGYKGSAVALVVSSGIVFGVYCYIFRDLLLGNFLLKAGMIPFIGILLTGAIQLLSTRFSVIYSLPLGIAFFIACLLRFQLISLEELTPILGFFRKRRLTAFKH
jgi:O-antigen/teichoic acid export membrane protein